MILEDAAPVHVHNPRKNKRKHGGVLVSEPERSTRLSPRSAGLSTKFSPFHMDLIMYIFISLLGISINRDVHA